MLFAIIFIMYIESAFVAFLLNLLTDNFNHDKSFIVTSKIVSFLPCFLFWCHLQSLSFAKRIPFPSLFRLFRTCTLFRHIHFCAHTHTVHSVTEDKTGLRTLSFLRYISFKTQQAKSLRKYSTFDINNNSNKYICRKISRLLFHALITIGI